MRPNQRWLWRSTWSFLEVSVDGAENSSCIDNSDKRSEGYRDVLVLMSETESGIRLRVKMFPDWSSSLHEPVSPPPSKAADHNNLDQSLSELQPGGHTCLFYDWSVILQLLTFFFFNQSDVTSRTLTAHNSSVTSPVQQGPPRCGYLGTTASSRAKASQDILSSAFMQEEGKENLPSSSEPQPPAPLLAAGVDPHTPTSKPHQDQTNR